jgi:hypothetical protein
LVVDGELAEAVAEVLARYVSGGVVLESTAVQADEDRQTEAEGGDRPVGPLRVSGYLPVDDQLEANRQRLEESLWYLGRIRPLPALEFRTVQEADWAEAWKERFQPIPIGKRLLVAPTWAEVAPAGREILRIDPGMAFGTGTHPTTQLCLELLDEILAAGQSTEDGGRKTDDGRRITDAEHIHPSSPPLGLGVPRGFIPQPSIPLHPLTPVPLHSLLDSAGLLDPQGIPHPEPTRAFLEASRGEALSRLVKVWLESQTFNELGMLPGLVLEGEWANDPLQARRKILGFLAAVPKDTWWSLEAFIAAIRQRFPDFQRPAGDYDSWFIRREGSEAEPLGTSGDVEIQSEAWNPGEGVSRGEYLRGFEHWDEVDGALVRFIITGPLHWLGVLDLAAPAEDKPVSAFRASRWAEALLQGEIPKGLLEENESLQADSQGRLRVLTRVPRTVRYQVARFCAWEGWDGRTYRYRLTPGGLERARGQGLRIDHLLGLMRRHTAALPPALVKALERWEAEGTPARIEPLVVLRVASPEILQRLRASRAARFLGDPLGPTAVIVKPGAQEKVLAALAEMGYLGELIHEE